MRLIIETDMTVLEHAINDDTATIIFPDFIQIRNFLNYLIRKNVKAVSLERIFTVGSFITGAMNIEATLVPRFLERIIAKQLILKLPSTAYEKLVNYPEFISLFLEEFYSIDSNNIHVSEGAFEYFEKFALLYREYLRQFNMHTLYSLERMASDHVSEINFKKIYFVNFFMIDNSLLSLITALRSRVEVIMLYYDSDALSVITERIPDYSEIHHGKRSVPQTLQFLAVPDQRAEVITIARSIIRLILENNLHYSDFMVSFRDAKLYEPLIREVFEQYSIPYFIEVRHRFQDLSIYLQYRTLLSRFLNSNMSAEQILDSIIQGLEVDMDEYRDALNFIDFLDSFRDYVPYLTTLLGTITPRQLASLLDLYIGSYTYGGVQYDSNSVKVIDIGNIFFNAPRYLFVGNMKEGIFPRNMDSKELIPGSEKSRVPGFYYRTAYMDLKNEDYYFDTLMQSAEHIIFTYPYRDQTAKREYQSKYLRKLEYDSRLKMQEYDPYRLADGEVYSSRELLYTAISSHVPEQHAAEIMAAKPYRELQECKTSISSALKSREFTPSELTMYKKCGLRYFYRHVAGIIEPELPFGPASLGTLYHQILRDYYSEHRDFKIADITDTVHTHVSRLGANIDPALLELLEMNIAKSLRNFLGFDAYISRTRRVYGVEKAFTWPLRDARINGRIDRIDSVGENYIVIDYKYTSPTMLKKLDTDLDLKIYMSYLQDQHFKVLKGYYYSLKLPRARYTPQLESKYSKVVHLEDSERLKSELESYISGIRNAQFLATVSEDCDFCEYRSMCDYYLRGGA